MFFGMFFSKSFYLLLRLSLQRSDRTYTTFNLTSLFSFISCLAKITFCTPSHLWKKDLSHVLHLKVSYHILLRLWGQQLCSST